MTRNFKFLTLLAMSAALIISSGCSRFGDRKDPLDSVPVEQLYMDARTALDGGNMGRAERLYRGLIARYPFGRYTEQSQLELAYAQFRSRNEEEALSTLNRFLRTYPTSSSVDYAYYLRGLINFDRTSGFLDRWVGQDPSLREQTHSVAAFQDFSELITRFPQSPYAPDARQRMVFLRNNMAQYEINIASYYLRRGAWVAAANRGRFVVENYQESPQTAEALAIMVQAYRELGERQLAEGAFEVLQLNYPNHRYARGEFDDVESPSVLRRVWRFFGGSS